ncbi:MAG TPA: hypothetical protein VN282_19100 [Pyrinomonadaceae bacterium]|nr:hypothetical protein [Pyrinomonadaceae bacterium]
MNENPVVWVILAPTDAARLDEEANEFRRKQLGWGEKYLPKWEARAGAGDYSALINRNPGTQDTHESPLASSLSLKLGKPVYVLYPDEDSEDEGVLVYEGGKYAGELAEAPSEFARARGCTLTGAPEGGVRRAGVAGVVLVEGASAAEAARALGYDAPPGGGGDLRILDGPAGALLTGVAYARLAYAARQLSEAFPSRDIYTLSSGPTPGRFLCRVVREGEDVGVFERPAVAGGGAAPRLDSVKGQTTPAAIADALGVPRDWLDLSQDE